MSLARGAVRLANDLMEACSTSNYVDVQGPQRASRSTAAMTFVEVGSPLQQTRRWARRRTSLRSAGAGPPRHVSGGTHGSSGDGAATLMNMARPQVVSGAARRPTTSRSAHSTAPAAATPFAPQEQGPAASSSSSSGLAELKEQAADEQEFAGKAKIRGARGFVDRHSNREGR